LFQHEESAFSREVSFRVDTLIIELGGLFELAWLPGQLSTPNFHPADEVLLHGRRHARHIVRAKANL